MAAHTAAHPTIHGCGALILITERPLSRRWLQNRDSLGDQDRQPMRPNGRWMMHENVLLPILVEVRHPGIFPIRRGMEIATV
ncbi:MAG: hypothetical protein M2R45_04562 [Verrucomicrobia subdivision 3 bacterium]|nr:hypothetical protein [Limisphaerales bacterium]MCS1416799.1 hypothetical protein [Limisphaerales bacterium]